MAYTYVNIIVYLNLNSIFNILNAVATNYGVFTTKNT